MNCWQAQLIPQLIINYKLKVCVQLVNICRDADISKQSVSHMNGRSMGYKFLSTIVDDLFA